MATNYPSSEDSYTTKTDNVDDVLASHINDLQDAVEALQGRLGTTSDITDGNVPYMSASGFADSPISTDGTDVTLAGITDDNVPYMSASGFADSPMEVSGSRVQFTGGLVMPNDEYLISVQAGGGTTRIFGLSGSDKVYIGGIDSGVSDTILRRDGNDRLTLLSSSQYLFAMTTESLKIVDAGSTGATEQDWVEVEVGGVTGYVRIYASK